MAAAAGILNHQWTAGQALTTNSATPMDSPADGTSSTSSDSTSISANDFLTLLVTEMQNQDPTADTDPNEYINQLVQVNSLEQLISINQNISSALGSSSASDGSSASSEAGSATPGLTGAAGQVSAHKAGALAGAQPTATGAAPSSNSITQAGHAAGNLSVPDAKLAADRVAHALDGRSRARAAISGLTKAQ
jgi:flagellar basal-body rod modification protein FlgD